MRTLCGRWLAHLLLACVSLGLLAPACGEPRPRVTTPLVPSTASPASPRKDHGAERWLAQLRDGGRDEAVEHLLRVVVDARAHYGEDAPEVRGLLERVIVPLTNAYVDGRLEKRTRHDLLAFLVATGDVRTSPALAEAIVLFEGDGKEEDLRLACGAIAALAEAGKLDDTHVIDSIWTAVETFPHGVRTHDVQADLADAFSAAMRPSYGPKAVALLEAHVARAPSVPIGGAPPVHFVRDTFARGYAASAIVTLKYAPGIKALIGALLTFPHDSATMRDALLHIWTDAEPWVLAALRESEPDLAKITQGFKNQEMLAILADILGHTSRPSGRDAVTAAAVHARTPLGSHRIAAAIAQFPPDAQNLALFMAHYRRVPEQATAGELAGGRNRRSLLFGEVRRFHDPSVVPWLLKELASSKAPIPKLEAYESALHLMTPEQRQSVKDALRLVKQAALAVDGDTPPGAITSRYDQMFAAASAALDRCKKDSACYVRLLDDPAAQDLAVKAATMSAVYGAGANAAATRAELVQRFDKVKHLEAREALALAVDVLAPKGDIAAADAIDRVMDADHNAAAAAGIPTSMTAELLLVAWNRERIAAIPRRLRARAIP